VRMRPARRRRVPSFSILMRTAATGSRWVRAMRCQFAVEFVLLWFRSPRGRRCVRAPVTRALRGRPCRAGVSRNSAPIDAGLLGVETPRRHHTDVLFDKNIELAVDESFRHGEFMQVDQASRRSASLAAALGLEFPLGENGRAQRRRATRDVAEVAGSRANSSLTSGSSLRRIT